MAHVEKYARGAVGNMFDHYARGRGNVERSNQNINPARTHLNYNLAPEHQGGQVGFLRQRLSQVKVQNRADVNVFCDWIVTIPKDFLQEYPQLEEKFFKSVYHFLEKRYGEENVISAYVHKDEVTPHIHFAFVPVVPDKKRGGFKVSAKERLTRSDLQSFHQDLNLYLIGNMGHVIPILNQATKDGNRSIMELKRQTASKERQKLIEDIETLKQDKKALQASVDDLKELSTSVQSLPKGKKAKIGQNIVLTPEEYQQLTDAANANSWEYFEKREAKRKIEQLEQRNRELESKSKERELMQENQKLKRENFDLITRNMTLTVKNQEISKAIDRLPISDLQKEQTKLGKSYPIKRNFDFFRKEISF